MKKILPLLAVVVLLKSCTLFKNKTNISRYPTQLHGVQELVLAVQDENLVITDTITSRKLGVFKSESIVTVMVPVTYKYFIDLRQGYNMSFTGRKGEEQLIFKAPPVEVQPPIIHSTEAIVRKKSLLINEQKELNQILESLPEKLYQKKMRKVSAEVVAKCEEELKEFLINYCRETGIELKNVKVKFQKDFVI
jgi:hypothetical protein